MSFLESSSNLALKISPVFGDIANSYYGSVVSNYSKILSINTDMDLNPTSENIGLWSVAKASALSGITDASGSANFSSMMQEGTSLVGSLGGPLMFLAQMTNGLKELSVNPSNQNAAIIAGGINGGAAGSYAAEQVLFGDAGVIAYDATIAAVALDPPLLLGAASVMAGATLFGFFAGRSTGNFLYNAPQLAEIYEKEAKQWF